MNLYIARNGEKLGPFSLAEAQNLVRAGTILPTDLAWYEGLASWIPLSQVPGFESTAVAQVPMPGAPQPPAQRPVLVWVICLFYFICLPFSLLSMAIMPFFATFLKSLPGPVPAGELAYFQNLGLWNYYMPAVIAVALQLTWAIQLFRLKRNSFYLVIIASVFAFGHSVYNMLSLNSYITSGLPAGTGVLQSIPMFVGVVFGLAIQLAIVYYNWHLLRKGVLR